VTSRIRLWLIGLAILAFIGYAIWDAARTPLGY